MITEYARLEGDREVELKVLREEFAAGRGKPTAMTNPMIERYRAARTGLDAARRIVTTCVAKPDLCIASSFIGFLLRNDEMAGAVRHVECLAAIGGREIFKDVPKSRLPKDTQPRYIEAFFLRALNMENHREMVVPSILGGCNGWVTGAAFDCVTPGSLLAAMHEIIQHRKQGSRGHSAKGLLPALDLRIVHDSQRQDGWYPGAASG